MIVPWCRVSLSNGCVISEINLYKESWVAGPLYKGPLSESDKGYQNDDIIIKNTDSLVYFSGWFQGFYTVSLYANFIYLAGHKESGHKVPREVYILPVLKFAHL